LSAEPPPAPLPRQGAWPARVLRLEPGAGPLSPARAAALAAGAGAAGILAAAGAVDPGGELPAAGGPAWGLELGLDTAPAPGRLAEMAAAGLALVRWRPGGAGPGDAAAALRAAVRAGVWSTLLLPPAARPGLAAWAADNPNLALNLEPEPRPPRPPDGLPPLPGRPAGGLVSPAQLLLLTARHGRDQVRRWRRLADGSLYVLARDAAYHFHDPHEAPAARLDEMERVILSAGKVGPRWLRYHLEHAFLVAWAEEQGVMIATEALKRPRQEYVDKVRQLTGIDFSGHIERGYIVVRPEHRGLGVGDRLIEGCLARSRGRKTFVVIGAENRLGQELTARHGSRLLVSYHSRELQKEIGIWTPADQEDLPEPGR
jgi:GNAT superfamily N-acetyltransferase